MIKKIIGFLALLISFTTLAQKNNISPYSFFGIGDNSANKSVEEISMGEIGGAFNSVFQLGFTNPASLASLRYTTYGLAAENKSLELSNGSTKESASSASLTYLALGFPIGENAGVAFGLRPNTTVGYSLTREFTNIDGDLTAINLFSGEGGTNRVFLGFGHKIGKNFNVGIEAAYIFGNIENSLLNRRDAVPLATIEKSIGNVRGSELKVGFQYYTKVSEKLILRSGLTFNTANELTNKGEELLYSIANRPDGIVSPRDTTVVNSFKINIKNPIETIISIGIGQENKWYSAIEYSFQDALNFDDGLSQNNNSFNYGKSSRISVGGFFTPKFNSITSYWQRTTYRAGLSYKQTGLIVNNTEINDFGISFGVGLPMGKQLSKINLGFELGQRGETTNNLLKENYFNFRVGLSLNDKWFRKRKID